MHMYVHFIERVQSRYRAKKSTNKRKKNKDTQKSIRCHQCRLPSCLVFLLFCSKTSRTWTRCSFAKASGGQKTELISHLKRICIDTFWQHTGCFKNYFVECWKPGLATVTRTTMSGPSIVSSSFEFTSIRLSVAADFLGFERRSSFSPSWTRGNKGKGWNYLNGKSEKYMIRSSECYRTQDQSGNGSISPSELQAGSWSRQNIFLMLVRFDCNSTRLKA